MAKTSLAGIAAALRAADSFLIASHPNPDGDAIGSILAAYHLLRALGKTAVTCVNDDPVPRIYQWLPGADQIVAATEPIVCPDVAIALDVTRRERLGKAAGGIKPSTKVIVIDHHLEDASFGDCVYQDAGASAVGEILVDLFLEAGVPISRAAAECAYVAIITDTGGFRFGNTTPHTHGTAARLLETGLSVPEISCRVFDTMSAPKLDMLRRLLQAMQRTAQGRIAYSMLTLRDMHEARAREEDLDGLVNFTRNIEGVRVGLLFREVDATTTKVSARSNVLGDPPRTLNCAELLSPFGGGGHRGAAGAVLDMPLEAARSRVLQHVQPLLEATP